MLWLINKDSCCVGLLSHVTRSFFGLGELGNNEDHIICLSATINKCDMMRGREHTERVLLVRESRYHEMAVVAIASFQPLHVGNGSSCPGLWISCEF